MMSESKERALLASNQMLREELETVRGEREHYKELTRDLFNERNKLRNVIEAAIEELRSLAYYREGCGFRDLDEGIELRTFRERDRWEEMESKAHAAVRKAEVGLSKIYANHGANTAPVPARVNGKLFAIYRDIEQEIRKACKKFPGWPVFPADAFNKLAEEIGELSREINQTEERGIEALDESLRLVYKEAIQSGAMVFRFIAGMEFYEFENASEKRTQTFDIEPEDHVRELNRVCDSVFKEGAL